MERITYKIISTTEKAKKLYDEISDLFLSLFNGLLLGDLLSHYAKIPGNNLAWKDSITDII